MNIQEFIIKHPHFVWWNTNPETLSTEAIVEATLNFGNWEDVQEIIDILGKEEVARIFFIQTKQRRSNYHPKTKHFFTLYFHDYALRNSQ